MITFDLNARAVGFGAKQTTHAAPDRFTYCFHPRYGAVITRTTGLRLRRLLVLRLGRGLLLKLS